MTFADDLTADVVRQACSLLSARREVFLGQIQTLQNVQALKVADKEYNIVLNVGVMHVTGCVFVLASA